jgi:hypothetical protein
VKIEIHESLNIGVYLEELELKQVENNFAEKLPIQVRVFKMPPNWKVDPKDFEASMNLVGKVKIYNVFSNDSFDKVAAFIQGTDSIRGVANLRYIKEFDSHFVFLNVYGQQDSDYKIDFRLCDASVGQIIDDVSVFIDGKDSIPAFKKDAVYGSTFNPVIFDAKEKYRQYVPLAKGWNWVSFNKKSKQQNNINEFLSSINAVEGDQIKAHGVGASTYSANDTLWDAGLSEISNKLLYQVKVSHADTIVYSGETLNPDSCAITLLPGWNGISYIPDLSRDVNDALRNYVADTSEVIKSQYAFSMYDPRVGWLGTLETMQPGLGYMLKVAKAGELRYPNTTIYKSVQIPHYYTAPSDWTVDLSVHNNNISIVAQLDLGDYRDIYVNETMVLGAFINGENHGFVAPLVDTKIGYEPFFLTVNNSSANQLIEFKLFDGVSGNYYRIKEKLPFKENAVYGTSQNPFTLTLDKTLSSTNGGFGNDGFFKCFPNPFNTSVNIEFIGDGEKITLDVVNENGARVSALFDGYSYSGINKFSRDGKNDHGGETAPGIYYIRLLSKDEVKTSKISKNR